MFPWRKIKFYRDKIFADVPEMQKSTNQSLYKVNYKKINKYCKTYENPYSLNFKKGLKTRLLTLSTFVRNSSYYFYISTIIDHKHLFCLFWHQGEQDKMYPVYFKFTKIPKRSLTWFKKAKELFGTPAKICFFSFSDQIIFLKHLDA